MRQAYATGRINQVAISQVRRKYKRTRISSPFTLTKIGSRQRIWAMKHKILEGNVFISVLIFFFTRRNWKHLLDVISSSEMFFRVRSGLFKKKQIPQLNDKCRFFAKRQKRTLFCLVFSSTRFGCEDHAEMSVTDENEAVKHPPSNYIDNLCSIRLCLSNFYTRRVLKCRHRVSEQNSF